MGVLGSLGGAAQGWDSLNRERPDPSAQEEKNSVGYEEGGWTVDLTYGSQRGKSLGLLAPEGLGKAEAEGSLWVGPLKLWRRMRKSLVLGKNRAGRPISLFCSGRV